MRQYTGYGSEYYNPWERTEGPWLCLMTILFSLWLFSFKWYAILYGTADKNINPTCIEIISNTIIPDMCLFFQPDRIINNKFKILVFLAYFTYEFVVHTQ